LDLIWLFVIWFLIWGFDLNHFCKWFVICTCDLICDLPITALHYTRCGFLGLSTLDTCWIYAPNPKLWSWIFRNFVAIFVSSMRRGDTTEIMWSGLVSDSWIECWADSRIFCVTMHSSTWAHPCQPDPYVARGQTSNRISAEYTEWIVKCA